MELVSCESERNEVAGFWAQNGGVMKLTNCVSDKDEVGVGSRGEGSSTTCQNVSVGGSSLGFLVAAGGSMAVEQSSVTRSTRSGVSCSDLGSRFSMVGGRVRDCKGSGVCAQDGSRVHLNNVQASGNRLCSFICIGHVTRIILAGCMSFDDTPLSLIHI